MLLSGHWLCRPPTAAWPLAEEGASECSLDKWEAGRQEGGRHARSHRKLGSWISLGEGKADSSWVPSLSRRATMSPYFILTTNPARRLINFIVVMAKQSGRSYITCWGPRLVSTELWFKSRLVWHLCPALASRLGCFSVIWELMNSLRSSSFADFWVSATERVVTA